MPGRNGMLSGGDYRYAFNGMETDKEVSGQGNSYTTQFRQYDPRLGRWKSLDPLASSYPQSSPFCAFNNNPIFYTDPLGLASNQSSPSPPATKPPQDLDKAKKKLYSSWKKYTDTDDHTSQGVIFENGPEGKILIRPNDEVKYFLSEEININSTKNTDEDGEPLSISIKIPKGSVAMIKSKGVVYSARWFWDLDAAVPEFGGYYDRNHNIYEEPSLGSPKSEYKIFLDDYVDVTEPVSGKRVLSGVLTMADFENALWKNSESIIEIDLDKGVDLTTGGVEIAGVEGNLNSIGPDGHDFEGWIIMDNPLLNPWDIIAGAARIEYVKTTGGLSLYGAAGASVSIVTMTGYNDDGQIIFALEATMAGAAAGAGLPVSMEVEKANGTVRFEIQSNPPNAVDSMRMSGKMK